MAGPSAFKGSSFSHNPYYNNTVNQILNGFNTSRKNIALYYQDLVDDNLSLPEEYCRKKSHTSCIHAKIIYKGDHHVEDLVKGGKLIF